jgi:hypothetical protein
MTASEVRASQAALLDVTVRLTAEFPELPAGSVMRCLARVARTERCRGVPEHLLATRSEARARSVLRRRIAVDRSLLTAS